MAQPNPTQSSPWLQLAIEALQLIFKEPPKVQESLRRMNRKTYPETAKALAQQEEQKTPICQENSSSSAYSPELMQEGYLALDAAVEENERLMDSINGTSSALATAKKCAELDGRQES